MESLSSLIKPKNNLLQKQMYSKIFKELFLELSNFDNYAELKKDLEFLVLACNMLELLVDMQKKHLKTFKPDKKKLIIDVFVSLFSLSEEDQHELQDKIQFIFDNEMIKKVSTTRLLKKKLSKLASNTFSLL